MPVRQKGNNVFISISLLALHPLTCFILLKRLYRRGYISCYHSNRLCWCSQRCRSAPPLLHPKLHLKNTQFNAEGSIGARIQRIDHILSDFTNHSDIVINSAHKLFTKWYFIIIFYLLLLVYNLIVGMQTHGKRAQRFFDSCQMLIACPLKCAIE